MASDDPQGPLKRTPLYELHREAGAKLVPFAGFEMPVTYDGVIEEHRAVRNAAGLFDVSHMGEIRVRGEGAERFLQRLTPNDVVKLPVGRAHYSGLLTEEGTYIDDLLCYHMGDQDYLLVVNAANRDDDLAWIEQHAGEWNDGLRGEHGEVEIEDQSEDFALLAIQGPEAVGIVSRLAEGRVAEVRYYGFTESKVGRIPALVSRTGYTGEDGFELYVRPEHAAGLWEMLIDAGTDAGLVPAGLGARDTLRLEAAMALYGHELDRTTTPYEAGLGWVVKLDQGDFVGRAALVAQKQAGVDRRLIGFEIEGRGIARQGHDVYDGDEKVGAVTSGTFSPTFEKALGLAYVAVGHGDLGHRLEIEVRGRRLAARVVETPFYKRPKG